MDAIKGRAAEILAALKLGVDNVCGSEYRYNGNYDLDRLVDDAACLIDALRAELERVTKELDAAIDDFKTYMARSIKRECGVFACDLCKYGGDYMNLSEKTYKQCLERNGDGVSCWEWRGAEEDG